jgi:hypothetical protein
MSISGVRRRSIAGEYTLSIPERLSALIKEGTVSCTLYISKSGFDAWYRFVSVPEIEHQSFDGEGVLAKAEELANAKSLLPKEPDESYESQRNISPVVPRQVDFTSESEPSDGSGDERDYHGLKAKSRESLKVPTTIQEAESLVRGRGLNHYRKQGVLNSLPLESLHERDFKRPIDSFVARAWCVAHKRGIGKVWGTIGNQVDSYGAKNIRQWWELAPPLAKATVLTSRNKLALESVRKEGLDKIRILPCPF